MQKGAGVISLSLHLYIFLLNIGMLSLHLKKPKKQNPKQLLCMKFPFGTVPFFPNRFVRDSVSLGFTIIKNALQFGLSTFTNPP